MHEQTGIDFWEYMSFDEFYKISSDLLKENSKNKRR